MPYKVNQERRHRIPKTRYDVKNWRGYDAAQPRRADPTVWVTADAIEAWTPANTGRRGRPQRYSEMVVETGLMLRLAFGRPWRQTEGMLASSLRLLALDLQVPDHTTFSRRSVDPTVAFPHDVLILLEEGDLHRQVTESLPLVFGEREDAFHPSDERGGVRGRRCQ